MRHWLVSLFSIDGVSQNAEMLFITGTCAMKLRAVCSSMKEVLEENADIAVNIHLTPAGTKEMTASFLLRWKGSIHLNCKHEWRRTSPWFVALVHALSSDAPPIIKSLHLLLRGSGVESLSESLTAVITRPCTLHLLHVAFRGRDFVASAAPLDALARAARAVRLDLHLAGRDAGGRRACRSLQLLRDAAIEPTVLALRSAPISARAPRAHL